MTALRLLAAIGAVGFAVAVWQRNIDMVIACGLIALLAWMLDATVREIDRLNDLLRTKRVRR